MTTDSIVKITDNARAVLALSDELAAVDDLFERECRRHKEALALLEVRRAALKDAILKIGGNAQ